ncbi:MAG TPA: potassium channel family protein [Dermatophilaceae bacterium]|nr:potassium channel family protein [Dermatophilaceae bacterium]
MTPSGGERLTALSVSERRRLLAVTVARSLTVAAAVVAAYYLMPLARPELDAGAVPRLLLGLGLLAAFLAWQVRRVLRARTPYLQAVESLVIAVPLFLCTYAGAYLALSSRHPDGFTEQLGRTDSLYFTVVTLGTVGYGDIAPVSDAARVLVASQVLLDLVLIAAVARLLLMAARLGVERAEAPQEPDPS